MGEVKCPYCEEENEIDYSDVYDCEENQVYEKECEHCGKYFAFSVIISYHGWKLSCLDGEDHKFNPTKTYPRMRCERCYTERDCTPEEMAEVIKIRG